MKSKDVVGEGRGEAVKAAPILGNRQTYILWELQPLQVALLRLVEFGCCHHGRGLHRDGPWQCVEQQGLLSCLKWVFCWCLGLERYGVVKSPFSCLQWFRHLICKSCQTSIYIFGYKSIGKFAFHASFFQVLELLQLMEGTGSLRPWISTGNRKSTGPQSGLFFLLNIRSFPSVRALKCTCGVWSSCAASLVNHPCSSSLLDASVCLWSLWLHWPFTFEVP